jgi:hypothetical protein
MFMRRKRLKEEDNAQTRMWLSQFCIIQTRFTPPTFKQQIPKLNHFIQHTAAINNNQQK